MTRHDWARMSWYARWRWTQRHGYEPEWPDLDPPELVITRRWVAATDYWHNPLRVRAVIPDVPITPDTPRNIALRRKILERDYR